MKIVFIALIYLSRLTDQPLAFSPLRTERRLSGHSLSADDLSFPQEPSETQRQQEMILEKMALQGADRVKAMNIPERAKRAMLAEALEDQIFELTEQLEGFVDEEGKITDREKAVEIASTTKSLQIQYNDLVSGKPSAILDALSTMGSEMNDD